MRTLVSMAHMVVALACAVSWPALPVHVSVPLGKSYMRACVQDCSSQGIVLGACTDGGIVVTAWSLYLHPRL